LQAAGRRMAVAEGQDHQHARDPLWSGCGRLLHGDQRAVASSTPHASVWAELGINVNCIGRAGFCRITQEYLGGRQSLRSDLRQHPCRTLGADGDFMGTVVFLASPASDYLHGSIIIVDGGLFLR